MSIDQTGFRAHLASGSTTVARAWDVTRRDGAVLGFTDHDRDLAFDDLTYTAQTGLSAQTMSQSTGLAVDNAEALGILNSEQVREEDIRAGRYDGAEVRAWLVNWQDTAQRMLRFRGRIGEVVQAGPGFRADLRGMTEALNEGRGFAYQHVCSAVLGDGRCKFDLGQGGFSTELPIIEQEDRRIFRLGPMADFVAGWFERGRLVVLDGAAAGLPGVIKFDAQRAEGREIELWEALGAEVKAGDRVRLEAGCDKRAETCKAKFGNFLNFRGFPTIPGEDWLTAYPVRGKANDGGRRST
ncbi:MAG: DUF2163 domain-containing protein [Pseudomonadota bacterium]